MSLNCNEINLILKELDLSGAFIQDIVQPGYNTLAFYTYKEGCPKTILICTAQNSVRINETRKKITKNKTPLRFMEYLRSHIKGCRINTCEQINLDRIILMSLSKSNEINGQIIEFNLYIKLWNNASNVILCNEKNIILETMFRRPEKNELKDNIFILPINKNTNCNEQKNQFPIREWQTKKFDNLQDCPSGYFTTFNSFIDYWYSEYAESLSRKSLLEKAEKWFNINYSKRKTALENLINKLNSFENADLLKHKGDLILANSYLIEKKSNILNCIDYDTGNNCKILLDPNKTPQENAAEYYKNYKKAISGKEELKHDIEIAQNQITKLEKQYDEIKNEQNPVKIEQLLRKDSTPKQQIKKQHPGLDYQINGWQLLVGRDSNENDDLLRHYVRGEDLWLHVRDYPGGYVFIKAKKNKTVPLDILLDAANLAVYYSKARNNTKVDLYYTHTKYLRRAKNASKGTVLPTQEKNLCITPDKERLKKLDFLHKENE